MSAETSSKLTLGSPDATPVHKDAHKHSRDAHIKAIHGYVVDGEPLQRPALDDMFKNPEALSLQLESLTGWVDAAVAGEEGVWLEKGAHKRLQFMKIVLSWSVEVGNGSADYHRDLTAGNGLDGLPEGRTPQFGSA